MRKQAHKQAIIYMIIAGKENDHKKRIRLLVESRVNRSVMNNAWVKGQQLRGGMTV